VHPPRSWLLIRHGETEASIKGEFRSYSQSPLTQTGREKAMRIGVDLASMKPGLVLSSPSERALDTARLAGFFPDVDPDLQEWNLGEMEGEVASEVRAANPGWSLFIDGPKGPTGESPTDAIRRARRMAERLRNSSESLTVVFSHGQFLRVLTCAMLDIGLDIAPMLALGPARSAFVVERAHGPALGGWNLPAGCLSTAVSSGWS
jgi:broad specificity phosphatase PhoE